MSSPRDLRPEIQALRALAVGMVVLLHVYPRRMPGGYAGVDVFFVISGFLITAHLLREVERTGAVDLPEFWARRARRLLPASFLVLAASSIAVAAVGPAYFQLQFQREIAASTLYGLNWVLAADAVDYLAADNAPSPAQHCWSLSIEEQFYVAWPLLLAGGLWLAGRTGALGRRATVAAVLGVVSAASFAACLWLTETDPARAYFVTHTRAWEFGVGGLLAVYAPEPPAGRERLRAVAAAAGLGAIGATAFLFGPGTPFPGAAALVPVLGTAAVLWAGSPAVAWSPTRLAALRPVAWLGDVSYSAYLWHWPPIVLVPYVTGVPVDGVAGLGVLGFTAVAAGLGKRFVEDPIREHAGLRAAGPARTFALTAAGMVAVLAIPAGAAWLADRPDPAALEALRSSGCFGAAAVDPRRGCGDPGGRTVLPLPTRVGEDLPAIYDPTCRADTREARAKRCVFGAADGPKVALVGDSHAASWFPALEALAAERGWTLVTWFKGGCAFGLPDAPGAHPSCAAWNVAVADALAAEGPLALVVTSHRASDPESGLRGPADPAFAGRVGRFGAAFAPVLARGTPVVAIRDAPLGRPETPWCVLEGLPATDRCDFDRAAALAYADALVAAAEAPGDAFVAVDLTDRFCGPRTCRTVAGGVVIWRDAHHFTATWSRTLAPALAEAITAAGVALP